MKKNLLIVQSGGPTAVINNSLVGMIDSVQLKPNSFNNVYGAVAGIHGLLNDDLISLNHLTHAERVRLRMTPGAALGTWRYKLTSDDYGKIIDLLKRYDVHCFCYIGGNGSMTVAKEVQKEADKQKYELQVIGVPKSIDNDLLFTDHCPGYGSAAKFLATSVMDAKMDMESYPENGSVTLIETMGRHTGWLAGACSLADQKHLDGVNVMIYVPEVPFHLETFIQTISSKEKERSIVVVAEGIKNAKGDLIDRNVSLDMLGRPILGGVSNYLKKELELKTSQKIKQLTLSTWQRSSMVLSSKTDLDEAYLVGQEAVRLLEQENRNIMVTIERATDSLEYSCFFDSVSLEDISGHEKGVPQTWYDVQTNSMTSQFKEYLLPLIKGEVILPMHNGLPVYQKVI